MSPDPSSAVESGAVYVFVRQNGSWTQQEMLKPSPPNRLEYFGTSLAISGDTVVVGAPSNDALGVTTLPATSRGAAYVFVRSGGAWRQQAKLVPKALHSDDFFGIEVAIQGDTILVGAPFDDEGGSHSGAIYEFTRNAETWTEGRKLKAAAPVEGGTFGLSIEIDAQTFITGAALDPTGGMAAGSAYVFVRNAGAWEEQQRLTMPKPVSRATFGWRVELSGDIAVVSAPRAELVRDSSPPGEVYVFERSAGRWSQTQQLTAAYPRDSDTFGSGLELSPTLLVIGSSGDASGSRGAAGDPARADAPRSGATYIYAKQDNKWVPTAYLKADNADAGDLFGVTVALAGGTLAVAAPFEASSANGTDGDANSNSAPRSGAVYIFQ